jgi:hypothetical protein
MDNIQTYERIMDRAGINPEPTCQIWNPLYSVIILILSSLEMVHNSPKRFTSYYIKEARGYRGNEASGVDL